MGCFNAVCNISGLPIHSGEPARVIIGLPSMGRRENSIVYSTDIVKPIALPISGIYDHYGNLEEIVEDVNTVLICKWFEQELTRGEIKIEKDKDDVTMPDGKRATGIYRLLHLIQNEALTVGRHGIHNNVHFCYSMVLDAMWKPFGKSIEKTCNDSRKRWAEVTKKKYVKQDTLTFFKSEAELWYAWIRKAAKATKESENKEAEFFFGYRFGADGNMHLKHNREYTKKKGFDQLKPLNDDNAFMRFLNENTSDLDHYKFSEIYHEPLFKETMETGGFSEWVALRNQLADFYRTTNAMELHGKFWLPFMCAHSQCNEPLDFQKKFLKACFAQCVRTEKKFERDR